MSNSWGRIIWIFFHTIAEKVDAEFFEENTEACLNIITSICQNLPCPICTMHAQLFLRRYNIKHIKTKEDFKKFLYIFHNHTNAITKKKRPTIEILDIYKRAIFDKVAIAFIKTYNNKSPLTRSYADKMHRRNLAKDIANFIKNNYRFFNN